MNKRAALMAVMLAPRSEPTLKWAKIEDKKQAKKIKVAQLYLFAESLLRAEIPDTVEKLMDLYGLSDIANLEGIEERMDGTIHWHYKGETTSSNS